MEHTRMSPVNNSRLRTFLWIAGIFGLAFLVYLPAIRSGFIWDDDDYVTANFALRSLAGLKDIWLHPGTLSQYYPLTYTSFWVNYQLGGLNPAGYHIVNVLLHFLNTLLVWRLLERLKVPGARWAALVFLVHPVHVESVAWITERKNVLAGFFYLSAFLAYLRSKESGPATRRWYAFSFVLFLGALLSKTVTATFPVAVLLVLGWKEGRFPLKDLMRLTPFLLAGMTLGGISMRLEDYHVTSHGTNDWDLTFAQRFLIAGKALWFYLGKWIWPHPIIFIYPRWTVTATWLGSWSFPVSFLLLGIMLWRFRARIGQGAWTAWAIFSVTLFPALGFRDFFPMRFSFVADHFQYLASIASTAAIAAAACRLFSGIPRIRLFLAVLILTVLSWLSWNRAHVYQDLETLWRDTIRKNPSAWMAHNNLSAILIGQERYDEAIRHEQEALRLYPESADSHSNLGMIAVKRNQPEKSLAYFQEALRLRPKSGDIRNNLGYALLLLGEKDKAIEEYLKAIELSPGAANIRCNLGNVLLEKGETDHASRWYREAIALDPGYKDAYVNLGLALFRQDKIDDAIFLYEKALGIDPGLPLAHAHLAEALMKKGLPEKAERHLQEAIRLAPSEMKFRVFYANLLERSGKIDEAIGQYNQILERDPKNPEAQRNLLRIAFGDFQNAPLLPQGNDQEPQA